MSPVVWCGVGVSVALIGAGSLYVAMSSGGSEAADLRGVGSVSAREGPRGTVAEKFDPAADDWDVERINQRVSERLTVLGQAFEDPDARVSVCEAVCSANATGGALRPGPLRETFADSTVRVAIGPDRLSGSDWTGAGGLADAINGLCEPFGQFPAHAHFKVVRVTPDSETGTASVRLYYQAEAIGPDWSVQQNAVWETVWSGVASGDGSVRLASVAVRNFSEKTVRSQTGTLFTDRSAAVLGANPSYEAQLLRGTNHWRRTIPLSMGIDLFGHQGLGLGDVNGDGMDDLYVCQPGGVPNRLYVQRPDGTALDASAASGLDLLDRTRSALFVDLDNDGDRDAIVVVDIHAVFFANDGSGVFERQTAVEIGTATSLAAADFDLDGLVDIYACGYSAPAGGEGAPIPYHDANNGYRNTLIRNQGFWAFEDVTSEVGLEANNRRYTLSASWEDYDNDGDPDLYVANDFGRNCLYRNDDGRFVNVAPEAGVEDLSAGMGVTWGDYNLDGLMDVYVSNMFSSAGNRVAYQRRFRSADGDATKSQFQRHARGNSLFENAGDGTFRDVTVEAGVEMGRWAWSSLFMDVNNDGLQDLMVNNGLVTNDRLDDL